MSGVRRDMLEVMEFAVVMAREFPAAFGLAGHFEALMKLGRRYSLLMERECNTGGVSEKTVARLEAKVRAVCEEINPACVPVFSGDPRGATVKLKVPSGKVTDWGGVGVCVPGS